MGEKCFIGRQLGAIFDFLQLLATYGYAGIFLVSILGTSSILFNAAYYSLLFAMAVSPLYNPIFLVLSSSVGASLGDFVSYFIGYGTKHHFKRRHFNGLMRFLRLHKEAENLEKITSKYFRFFKFAKKWFRKSGFLTIVVFTLTPLPDDIIGLVAGAANYNRFKFFLAVLAGKLVQTSAIVLFGRYSYEIYLKFFLRL